MKARTFSPTKVSYRATKFRAGAKGLMSTVCSECHFPFIHGDTCIRCAWAERSGK